jgi:hypothetical protein
MNKFAACAASTATVALVVLNGGTAMASGGQSSGTWPTNLPLPTDPGTVISQSSTNAVVRSTDTPAIVRTKLDDMYVTQMGCTRKLAINRPRDYVCSDPETDKTLEVYFTFAALDPTADDASRSQTNAFYVKG